MLKHKYRNKSCKVCKTEFKAFSSTTLVCSIECAIKYNEEKNEKKEKRRKTAIVKEAKAALKRMDEQKLSYWFNACKAIAQKYARLRDCKDGCISCDKPPNWHGRWHGSHFRPAGNYKAVALNLWNIHKACSECNAFKSGNLINYQDRLIEKIGQKKVDWLKSQTQPHKHTKEYLQRYKKVIGKRCRQLEKRIING